jgi:maleylacetoacetate isomerase
VKLYTYFRSSAAYRVRIGLNLKGLAWEAVPVHMVKDGGRHLLPDYRAINPQGRIPALVLDDGTVLTQSLAILDWLDEAYPTPPLLPSDPVTRAKVRAAAHVVASDIHPVNNATVLRNLRSRFGADDAAVNAWYAHWVTEGFAALEEMIAPGPYAFGPTVTLADLCLVPQVYNARRFKVPLEAFAKIRAVEEACLALPAFADARPEAQPDCDA